MTTSVADVPWVCKVSSAEVLADGSTTDGSDNAHREETDTISERCEIWASERESVSVPEDSDTDDKFRFSILNRDRNAIQSAHDQTGRWSPTFSCPRMTWQQELLHRKNKMGVHTQRGEIKCLINDLKSRHLSVTAEKKKPHCSCRMNATYTDSKYIYGDG